MRLLLTSAVALAFLTADLVVRAGEDDLVFYRGINLNGPPVAIDGRRWEGKDAKDLLCKDQAFEAQGVALSPATDPERARMIRSSRWAPDGRNRMALTGVPAGTYVVWLYVWEDNDPQTYRIALEGRVIVSNHNSGRAGHWDRLGPWEVTVDDGSIEITSQGGHANFSGIEVWRRADGVGKVSVTGAARTPKQAGPKTPPPEKPEPEGPKPQGVDPETIRRFDETIAPLLARNCLGCHNATDRQGGLDLSSAETASVGGRSGPVLEPGQPDESRLWERVETDEMPPETPLPAAEKAALRAWIAAGARWGAGPIAVARPADAGRVRPDWWSLRPVARPAPPTVRDAGWVRNPIDAFVRAKLEARGLDPSPKADRRTLIRRLGFDLLGLPPSPEEVAAFEVDRASDAYERLVDRLLDSPHYGQRWARHWLDVVRFAESQGFERNKLWPEAWRYRDWVIEALNADLPYDQFVRLQLAGDVLRPDDPLAVIATGQLVAGPYDLVIQTEGTAAMRAAAREEELEGIVGTVAQAYLGLTVHCARCHDHKFDPIRQAEYYQFAAALGGVRFGERDGLSKAGQDAARRRREELTRRIDDLKKRPSAERDPVRERRPGPEVSRLEAVRRLLEPGRAHAVTPQQPAVFHVVARGDFRQKGEPVHPRGLAAVAGPSPDFGLAPDSPEAERRKALAGWITDPKNPLTPRVIVNRLWHHHFGVGLVETPSDLGQNGGRPSHPELLDWLAGELIRRGWSLKAIHRAIVLSSTYRQASRPRSEALAADADNRLLWRISPRRLEAEALRDAVLAVSGGLDETMGGPGYRDVTITSGLNEVYTPIDAVGPEFRRRTIYRTWVRSGTQPLLDAFDCPDPTVATPRRTVTTTPLQALALLNNAFLLHGAEVFAGRLRREAGDDVGKQVERAYLLAFARRPDEQERSEARRFIGEHGLAPFCLVLFNANEFLCID